MVMVVVVDRRDDGCCWHAFRTLRHLSTRQQYRFESFLPPLNATSTHCPVCQLYFSAFHCIDQQHKVLDQMNEHRAHSEAEGHAVKSKSSGKASFLSNLFGKGSNAELVQQDPMSETTMMQNPLEEKDEPISASASSSSSSSRSDHTYTLPRMENPSSGTSDIHDREVMETEVIKTLLSTYFNIVRKNISDTVPKSIMHFLVNKSKQSLQSELVRALYKEELFDELLSENEEIAARRKATTKMLRVLQKANDVLSEIRDTKL